MPPAPVERLWLEELERLAGRAAHEIKNPLNGLAVNLEVVRSRAAREGVSAAALAPYAEAAAEELARALALVDALLTLARPARVPVDLWEILRPLVRLYGAIVAAEGGVIELEQPAEARAETGAGAHAVRMVLAVALAALTGGAGGADGRGEGAVQVRARVERRGGSIAVTFHASHPPAPVPQAVRAAAAASGIELACSRKGITLVFAASGRDATDIT